MNETSLFSVRECDNIVKKYLKSDTVKTVGFTIVSLNNQNYLVKIDVHHESQKKTLKFFAKSTPKLPKINKILFDDFKKTLPTFDPKITPKLYYDKSDLLLFEDLTWQGFKSCEPKTNNLDLKHIKVVLGVLAKFHAGSFAYEEIKSKKTNSSYRLDEEYNLVSTCIDLKASEVVSLISSLLDESSKNKLPNILKDLEERQLSNNFRRTLGHGNLISKNIMFKYKEGIPVESKLINFRSKQYVPPLYDVLQIIFLNTRQDFRQHNYEFLLTYYHKCLKAELDKYFLKVDDILSYEDLRLEAHFYLPLIKLEAGLKNYNETTLQELKEIIQYPILSREDCYTIVEKKIGHTAYKFIDFIVTPLDQVNGFLGNYHKLKLRILHKTEETINCFIKCMPKGNSSKGIVEETGCFLKEIFIYQILVPQMQKHGINTINECLPACYFQRSEDLMVFDDIALKSYQTLKAQKPFDFNLLTLSIKKVAKFHASMIAFEEKMSTDRPYRLGKEYEKYLEEIFFSTEDHAGAVLMQTGLRSIPDVMNLFPKLKNEENQQNFKKCWPKLQKIFFTVTHPSNCYRNVLNHGDLWTNNMMVQFENTKPVDCQFIDYQCIRYCPPAHDYLSVLHLTTNRGTRMKHEEELKLIYHNELAEVLASYDCDINKILPLEEFNKTIDYIRPQIVMQSIMYNSFCMCTSEEISSFLVNDEVCRRVFFEDRKEYLATMFQKSEAFKAKEIDCILDLYDICNTIASTL